MRGRLRLRGYGRTLTLTLIVAGTILWVKPAGAYLLAAPSPWLKGAAKFEYLAMGDSFASGDGAYDYRAGTNTQNNSCRQSANSYFMIIKKQLKLTTAESLACSGARLRNIVKLPIGFVKQAKDKRISADVMSKFLPGYLSQINFQSAYKARVVTVSIGGNNIGFGKKLLRCIEADTCYSSYEDRLEIVKEINSKFEDLVYVYQRLRQVSPADSHIYAFGYPELAKNNSSCGLNVLLNKAEIKFSNQVISYLNLVIAWAAQKAGVKYVDLHKFFHGHRLCETSPSKTAVNGLTFGDDRVDWGLFGGPVGSESYHPNKLGHKLIAEYLLARLSDLDVPMPVPKPLLPDPTVNPALALLNAPKTGRPIYKVNYDEDLSNNVIIRGGTWKLVVDSIKEFLKPHTLVRIFLWSDPIELGSYETDENGGLVADIKLPGNTPTGFHTLHIYGEDEFGEPVDIYKVVYVAASSADLDGDGILNQLDHCLNLQNQQPVCEPTKLVRTSVSGGNKPGPSSSSPTGIKVKSSEPAKNNRKTAVKPAVKTISVYNGNDLNWIPVPVGIVCAIALRRLNLLKRRNIT